MRIIISYIEQTGLIACQTSFHTLQSLFLLPMYFLSFLVCSNELIFFALNHCSSNISPSSCLLYNSSGFLLSSPLFNETVFSYAILPWPQTSQSYLSFMEFELTFRPSVPDGVLLYSDDAGSGDFLAINLVDRYVEFRFDCGSGGAVIRYWTYVLSL